MTKGRDIALVEHETIEAELAPADVQVLLARYRKRFRIEGVGGHRYRLRAKSWVGSVRLVEVTLRVAPKCGLQNLIRMFAEVYEFEPSDDQVERAHSTEPSELLVAMLTTQVEALVGRGVRHSYAEVERWSTSIRGRILVGEALRRPSPQRLELPCRSDTFTPDIFANRVIRFTLNQLIGVSHSKLANRIERLRRLFNEVGHQRVRPAQFAGLRYTRLDAHYGPIHALCRIILEARGVDEGHGPYEGPTLLFDMNALFERFVARRIEVMAPAGWFVDRQHRASVDDRGRIPAIPDVVCSAGRRPIAVIDTKYKMFGSTPSSADAYQALAYARILGLRRVTLLYPNIREQSRFVSADGENELLVDGIDLSGDWGRIEADLGAMMGRLIASAGGSSRAAVRA